MPIACNSQTGKKSSNNEGYHRVFGGRQETEHSAMENEPTVTINLSPIHVVYKINSLYYIPARTSLDEVNIIELIPIFIS